MKKIVSTHLAVLLLLAAAPICAKADTYFADYFTNSSNINSASPGNPTTNSTSYETISAKTWVPTPSITSHDLKFGIAASGSGVVEIQALFATNAIALSQIGDYIQLTVVFTNTSGLLTQSSSLGFGLYNSGQVKPVAGGLNGTATTSSSTASTGGAQLWQGYVAQLSYTGGSLQFLTRAAQTVPTLANNDQDLVTSGSSSSSYRNPAATGFGGVASALTLTTAATYTEVLTITMNNVNSLAITNTLYAGPNTSATVVTNFGSIATNTTYLTSGFDGLAVGWRATAATAATTMDISSIVVSGQVSVPIPPVITSQPIPAAVPIGGSAAFSVSASGVSMAYHWYRYGTNVNSSNLSVVNSADGNSSMLVISPASSADFAPGTGTSGYYVVVTGAGNLSVTSSVVSLGSRTAKSLTWAGPAAGIWDINTNANWLDAGNNPSVFNYGDSVAFTGGSGSAVLGGNYLAASSVTVNGSYQFSGAGSFAGPGSLNFQGTFLEIDNANTYSGGTTANNASGNAYLYLKNPGALGTGPLTLGAGLNGGQPSSTFSGIEITTGGSSSAGFGDIVVANDAGLQFDATGSFAGVVLGNLSGTAGKTLTLYPLAGNTSTTERIRIYGTNTVYNANLNLSSSVLMLASYQSVGSQTYNGVISGSGAFMEKGAITYLNNGNNTYSGGTTPATGVIALGADSDPTPDNPANGPLGTGPLFLAVDSTTSLNGSGMLLASGSAHTIANSIQYPSGTNNLSLAVGGTNDLTFTGTFSLQGNDGGGAGTNRTIQVTNTALTTFSGPIVDGGLGLGLIKTGTGILALNNTETYTGPTTISNGTLRVNGQIGAGAVTVATNASLGGTGTITGPVTVLAGGAIAPGNSIGTLNINNNLVIAGNLSIEVNNAASPSSDKTVVSGILTNAGTGTVTVTNLGPALVAGNAFTLFNKPLTNGAVLTVTGAGVNWTNKLAIDGSIAVLSAIPTTPPTITNSVSGNTLTISWPASYLGWSLESNSVSLLTTNWFPVPNSSTVTSFPITVNPAKTNVFYRLFYQP